MPERQEVDGNAQADAPGSLGNRRGHNQRRRHNREVLIEVQFRQPGAIETQALGMDNLFNGFLIARGLGLGIGAR